MLILLILALSNALTPITSCTNITVPGEYYLANDIIENNSRNCIVITTSNVTIDGNGKTLAYNYSSSSRGYLIYYLYGGDINLTIKNLTLRLLNWSGDGLYINSYLPSTNYINLTNVYINNNTLSSEIRINGINASNTRIIVENSSINSTFWIYDSNYIANCDVISKIEIVNSYIRAIQYWYDNVKDCNLDTTYQNESFYIKNQEFLSFKNSTSGYISITYGPAINSSVNIYNISNNNSQIGISVNIDDSNSNLSISNLNISRMLISIRNSSLNGYINNLNLTETCFYYITDNSTADVYIDNFNSSSYMYFYMHFTSKINFSINNSTIKYMEIQATNSSANFNLSNVLSGARIFNDNSNLTINLNNSRLERRSFDFNIVRILGNESYTSLNGQNATIDYIVYTKEGYFNASGNINITTVFLHFSPTEMNQSYYSIENSNLSKIILNNKTILDLNVSASDFSLIIYLNQSNLDILNSKFRSISSGKYNSWSAPFSNYNFSLINVSLNETNLILQNNNKINIINTTIWRYDTYAGPIASFHLYFNNTINISDSKIKRSDVYFYNTSKIEQNNTLYNSIYYNFRIGKNGIDCNFCSIDSLIYSNVTLNNSELVKGNNISTSYSSFVINVYNDTINIKNSNSSYMSIYLYPDNSNVFVSNLSTMRLDINSKKSNIEINNSRINETNMIYLNQSNLSIKNSKIEAGYSLPLSITNISNINIDNSIINTMIDVRDLFGSNAEVYLTINRSNLTLRYENIITEFRNNTSKLNLTLINSILASNLRNLYLSNSEVFAYNNYFNNTRNNFTNSSGYLNTSKTLGISIINTSFIGGNYWKGYSDLCPDFDGDGLCELPYVISSNIIDYLPLTNHTQHGTVLSGNFSTNTTPVFNISINVSPSINYTIYLYINGTLYDSISGSGVGNYSLGATLGSGNYTYWFVVNYTIGGFNYSYTYGNYSAYIDVNPPYVEIIDPKPLDYPSEPIVFLFNVSDDMNISCNFLLTRDATVVLNQSFSTSGLYNYTYSLVPGQYNLTLICSDGLNTNSTFVMFNSSNYSDPDRFNVTSENFSSNSSFNLFNVSVNVTGDYTIYLYINGTLYNSISGSGVGNYSLGATLGSGNYTYWFVVNYTIGGFNYSYTYGNYSAYVDIGLPSISILWPVDGESYTRGNRIIQILVTDDLSSTLSCQLNVTGPDSFNDIFTISNGHVYNYSYNFNSLGLYTMNVSCNDGFNQNQTSITFRIRESGGGSSDTINGSNSDLNQINNTLNDTTNESNSDLNQSTNTLSNTINNSNMNDTNQSIENNTAMNNNDSTTMNQSSNVNNQGQPNRSKTTSRTQQSDLEQSENQTIQQNESLNEIREQNILNQTEEKPSSEEPVKNNEESKNVSQQDLISQINNYISIGLSEIIKLSSPFPYLLLGSTILLLSRTIKLKMIPLQDRVILQFNNILDKPIKNLKVNIDGQELITDENGQIILPELPDEKNIKVKLFILTKK